MGSKDPLQISQVVLRISDSELISFFSGSGKPVEKRVFMSFTKWFLLFYFFSLSGFSNTETPNSLMVKKQKLLQQTIKLITESEENFKTAYKNKKLKPPDVQRIKNAEMTIQKLSISLKKSISN